MKATRFKLEGKRHEALRFINRQEGFELLMSCECVLVDGDLLEDGFYPFKNDSQTLVVAIPELGDSSNEENVQIHEWIDSFVDGLMEAVGKMKADEFEAASLEGMKGYSRIARFHWY